VFTESSALLTCSPRRANSSSSNGTHSTGRPRLAANVASSSRLRNAAIRIPDPHVAIVWTSVAIPFVRTSTESNVYCDTISASRARAASLGCAFWKCHRSPFNRSSRHPLVAMMKSAHLRECDNPPIRSRLDSPGLGSIFRKGQMGSSPIVVVDPADLLLVESDHVIQALAAQRPHEALGIHSAKASAERSEPPPDPCLRPAAGTPLRRSHRDLGSRSERRSLRAAPQSSAARSTLPSDGWSRGREEAGVARGPARRTRRAALSGPWTPVLRQNSYLLKLLGILERDRRGDPERSSELLP
jgi:hypothetical protein